MKTSAIAFILMFTIANAGAQEVNKIVFDEKAEQNILYGICTPAAFTDPMFNSWYTLEYNGYVPQQSIIEKLDSLIGGVTIRIVLGTWCSDSQREVPRFLKITSLLEINERLVIEIICVNRAKTAVEVGINEGYVEFVPTFIISRNGTEVGRIVEAPEKSLEEDLLNLLK